MAPGVMGGLYLFYLYSIPVCYRRNKSMQFPIHIHIFNNLRLISLKAGAVITQFHSCNFANEPVGNYRGKSSDDKWILPFLPPAINNVIFTNQGNQLRNVFRVILKISVNRNNNIPLCMVETCCPGRCFSEIAPEAQQFYFRIFLSKRFKKLQGFIGTSIINEEELII